MMMALQNFFGDWWQASTYFCTLFNSLPAYAHNIAVANYSAEAGDRLHACTYRPNGSVLGLCNRSLMAKLLFKKVILPLLPTSPFLWLPCWLSARARGLGSIPFDST